MKVSSFEFLGSDSAKIYVKSWFPENEPKAVVQIVHGMAEHVERYNEFAEFLVKNNFGVYANDHRGHGKTAQIEANFEQKNEKLGFFTPKNGDKLVVEDVIKLAEIIKEKHPAKPHFVIGHSMGSFITRAMIMKSGLKFDGVVISGTSSKKGMIISTGKLLACIQGTFKGKTFPSKTLTGLSFKDYNVPFKPTKTPFDWLSRDHERNQNYWEDRYCGFVCSARFFYDLSGIIQFINKPKNIKNISKELPLFFISGTMDPVGEFTKGVETVYNNYKNNGVKDIKLKFYEGGRHESLNETNRQEVYNDILLWFEEHIVKS